MKSVKEKVTLTRKVNPPVGSATNLGIETEIALRRKKEEEAKVRDETEQSPIPEEEGSPKRERIPHMPKEKTTKGIRIIEPKMTALTNQNQMKTEPVILDLDLILKLKLKMKHLQEERNLKERTIKEGTIKTTELLQPNEIGG